MCLVKIVSQKNQIKTATFSTVKSINKTNAIPFVFEQIIFTKNASKSKKKPLTFSVILLTENTLKLSLPLWASEVYFVSEVILRIVKFCLWQSGQT